MNEKLCNLTIVLTNIKRNDYKVSDYKMSEKEANIVIEYLEKAKKEMILETENYRPIV